MTLAGTRPLATACSTSLFGAAHASAAPTVHAPAGQGRGQQELGEQGARPPARDSCSLGWARDGMQQQSAAARSSSGGALCAGVPPLPLTGQAIFVKVVVAPAHQGGALVHRQGGGRGGGGGRGRGDGHGREQGGGSGRAHHLGHLLRLAHGWMGSGPRGDGGRSAGPSVGGRGEARPCPHAD